jgi:hypothetical protein
MYELEIPAEVIGDLIPGWVLGPVLMTDGAMSLLEATRESDRTLDRILMEHLQAAHEKPWIPNAQKPPPWRAPQFTSSHVIQEQTMKVVSQLGRPESRVTRDQTIICLLVED